MSMKKYSVFFFHLQVISIECRLKKYFCVQPRRVYPGRVRLLRAPRAHGDLSREPGQAKVDHVQPQGSCHARCLLADAQVG